MRSLFIIIFVLSLVISGCSAEEKTITFLQIKSLFDKHGMKTDEPTGLHPANVFLRTLNGATPETLTINESQLLSFYIFTSSNEAKKGIKDFEIQTATASVVPHRRYQIANVLFFYVLEGSTEDQRVELIVQDMKTLAGVK